ncbi:hypothetical protein [Sphingobacterium sp.]|uniref:hypothetical protein n=1 Tax=Sphingobacterium sp. TaxID=341027 RepID=UPI0031E0CCD8
MDKKKFDVLVERESALNWHAFDAYTTPAGSLWPRFFYYYGNDIGFLEWSKKRAIEDFFWQPSKPADINLYAAQIRNLTVRSNNIPVKIALPSGEDNNNLGLRSLSLSGDLENFEILSENANPYIRLYPNVKRDRSVLPYRLPVFKALEKITWVDVVVEPLGQPLDCECLLQFSNLQGLNLTGNLSNVASLKKLEKLESLAIRYAPNLENFPSLNAWDNLKSFIGWNIEEITGKRLKTELKELIKSGKELEYCSVSKLRSSVWFTTEYGIPFTNWESKNAKIATKAYKTALQKIAKGKTENEVKQALVELIETINKLPNIETVEREDTSIAIQQLIEASPVKIQQETANNWFDEVRDF